jgi:hypothetical protein
VPNLALMKMSNSMTDSNLCSLPRGDLGPPLESDISIWLSKWVF